MFWSVAPRDAPKHLPKQYFSNGVIEKVYFGNVLERRAKGRSKTSTEEVFLNGAIEKVYFCNVLERRPKGRSKTSTKEVLSERRDRKGTPNVSQRSTKIDNLAIHAPPPAALRNDGHLSYDSMALPKVLFW